MDSIEVTTSSSVNCAYVATAFWRFELLPILFHGLVAAFPVHRWKREHLDLVAIVLRHVAGVWIEALTNNKVGRRVLRLDHAERRDHEELATMHAEGFDAAMSWRSETLDRDTVACWRADLSATQVHELQRRSVHSHESSLVIFTICLFNS